MLIYATKARNVMRKLATSESGQFQKEINNFNHTSHQPNGAAYYVNGVLS
jgi:hypothetical protein